jgi:hypothetical protein
MPFWILFFITICEQLPGYCYFYREIFVPKRVICKSKGKNVTLSKQNGVSLLVIACQQNRKRRGFQNFGFKHLKIAAF